ncbi:hypothetical protein METP1_03114 [Methanosarcinales archaeon]|nr:hypothetical protein METP1_03114 [Methanosarcinales archaeon]
MIPAVFYSIAWIFKTNMRERIINKRNIMIFLFLVIAAVVIKLHNAAPDSSTEILPGNYTYPIPAVSDVDKWWNRIDYLAETMHRTDGAWGGGYAELMPGSKCDSTHPLVRQTAHAVMGYIYAYQTYKKPIYKQRAVDGLQWLLDEQVKTGTDNGAFLYYCNNNGTIVNGGMYETSLGGQALLYGYREFGDIKYLNAATLAADWDIKYGYIAWNHNTNALGISFLSEYYSTTKSQPALDRSIYLVKSMLAKQNSAGYFDDIYNHNKIAYYHQIITRSLIQLYSAMPVNHPDRPAVSSGMYKAINYIVTHQNADGSMWLTPTDPTPNEEEYVIDGLGLAYNELNMPVLNVLNGLTNYYMSRQDIGKDAVGIPPDVTWKEPFEQKPFIVGYMVHFVHSRSNPLRTS